MSGKARRTLVTANLIRPNAIILDFATGKLFWGDHDLDKVGISQSLRLK